MVSDRLPRQGLILLAALSLFWGANWPVMKMVLSEVPPLYFRSCCLLLGGVGMLALARLSGVPIKVPSGQWNRVLWLAVFNISGWNALVIIGVSLLPSGRAALLGYTMPLWSMLLSVVFLGDRLSGRTVLGLLLGLAGIVVLMGGSVEGMMQAPLGVLCMILGAWSWAIGVVLFKRIPVAMPTSALTGWMMLAGSLPLLALAIPLETSRLVVPGTGPILGMLYNILVAFMFCYWAWNRIVQMVPVAVSSVSSLSTPLIGVLGGVLFLGEPLGWQEIVASLLILGAVGSVSLRR
jgi:drug/metabolite transporter (DMT)-like permease